MILRTLPAAAVVLIASFLTATPANAQRSGFIVGGGAGPGMVSAKATVQQFGISDRDSRLGLATNFHIGGVVGNSLELYWATHIVWHPTAEPGASYAGTGLTGVGIAYPLRPRVSIKGAAGWGRKVVYFSDGSSLGAWDGLGLLIGGRYGLSDRWALEFDVLRDSWNSGGSPAEEGSAWLLEATVNVLSH